MSVVVERLSKKFGTVTVIADLTVNFRENAISVLLGPSGSGKTTTLRCVAGLEEPNGGEIAIESRKVFSARHKINLPPEERGLGMVFQSYAIWPHMTVFENVALPLRAHRVASGDIASRVTNALSMVNLEQFRDRSATQLSGGQQQRVAIARCIVNNPRLILLDEPLGNLDAKLRVGMRGELKDLQRRIGATMIFVTHDQEEAMSLADEIFLFRDGDIAQQGSPEDLYRRPKTRYVAEFLGKANLFRGTVCRERDGTFFVRVGAERLAIAGDALMLDSGSCLCMVRPEAWKLGYPLGAGIRGRVESVMFIGDRSEVRVSTQIGTQGVTLFGYEKVKVGEDVGLTVDPCLIHLLPDT